MLRLTKLTVLLEADRNGQQRIAALKLAARTPYIRGSLVVLTCVLPSSPSLLSHRRPEAAQQTIRSTAYGPQIHPS